MAENEEATTEHYKTQERLLRQVTSLPFKFIGEYAPERVYSLAVFSPLIARSLANELSLAIPHPHPPASVTPPETYKGGHGVTFAFERWMVQLAAEAVNEPFLQKLEENDFLIDELVPMVNSLRERYFDVISAAANATACKRVYEDDLAEILAERG